jgi:hypothetical protein
MRSFVLGSLMRISLFRVGGTKEKKTRSVAAQFHPGYRSHGGVKTDPIALRCGERVGFLHFRWLRIWSGARMSLAEEQYVSDESPFVDVEGAVRDIGEVPAVELINTVAVHLMSAAAVKLGLGEGPDAVAEVDLDEARKLITSLAGLVVAAAPEISDSHARPLRDGLRSLQLAFRETSPIADAPGPGPGEKWTGPVS